MIKNFKNFKKMNESTSEEELLNGILDKISKIGYKNLSSIEKEILNLASTDGVDAISDYVDTSDEDKVTYDKLGHMLINGMTPTEYSNLTENEKEKKRNKGKKNYKWETTSKGSKSSGGRILPPYKVRVYKNDDSNILYYYIFWDEPQKWGTKEGQMQKFISISDNTEAEPFGKKSIIRKKAWLNKTLEQIHVDDLDDNYDKWKSLSPEELTQFETFLLLRGRFRGRELNLEQPKKDAKLTKDQVKQNTEKSKLILELKRLYKKFSNV